MAFNLPIHDQRYPAENILAFFRRNYHPFAEFHVESEWVPQGTRFDEFKAAIRAEIPGLLHLKELLFINMQKILILFALISAFAFHACFAA